MDQPVPLPHVTASIEGDTTGQIAVGNYNLQIGSVHGGVVTVIPPAQTPALRPRPTPVSLRPRPLPNLLDRTNEISSASTALQSSVPLQVYARAGTGKTALLRHLSHHDETARFPDGVVFLSSRNRPPSDLLQSLFDVFYESDVPIKATDAQIRDGLHDKRALIVLDDVEWAREDLDVVLDAAPACTVVLASQARTLWGEGRTIALRGLPVGDGLTLIERELGRRLTGDERPIARDLCAALDGHPLSLLKAAALVREQGYSLALVAEQIAGTAAADDALDAFTLASLTDAEQRLLTVLAAAAGDTPIGADHLAALTGIDDVAPVVRRLRRYGLIQAHSPRYSLTGTLTRALQQRWNLTPVADRAVRYFAAWAERHRDDSERLLADADALLWALDRAATLRRWSEVLRLGRVVEEVLALHRRWGAWRHVLEQARTAARAVGDRGAEAWAAHQIGTQALCLGDTATARSALIRALRLREMLGDEAGAAVTRHNLDVLFGPPAPPSDTSPPSNTPPAPNAATLVAPFNALFVAVLLFVSAFALVTRLQGAEDPNPTPTAPVAVGVTETPAPAATATVVPPTETPFPTATAEQVVEVVDQNDIEPSSTSVSPTTAPPPPTATLRPAPTATPCGPPSGWVVYTVQRGDTLTSLARRTGTTVAAIRNANCLAGTTIFRGQQLRLPVLPPEPTRVPTETDTPPTETPVPAISFYAEPETIDAGGCAVLAWDVRNVEAVVLDDTTVPERGEQEVCPRETTTYTLWVMLPNGVEEVYPATVTVLRANTPPRVTIHRPPDDVGAGNREFLYTGREPDRQRWYTDVALVGEAVDDEDGTLDGTSLVWTTDRTDLQPATVGTGTQPTVRLYSTVCEGTRHTITLTATDSAGASAVATRSIVIWSADCVDYPPEATIVRPDGNTRYEYTGYDEGSKRWYADVPLAGIADDPEDGALDGPALGWTTDRTDIQPAALGTGAQLVARLYSDRCAGTTHTIMLTARDSAGNRAQATRTITIWALC